jgi:hypothetical protein
MWDLSVTGGLLVAGWLIFWIGAFSPPYRQWNAPLKEYLQIIASHRKAWLWINICFVVGVGATIAGLVLLTVLLERRGSGLISQVGLIAMLVGATLWVIHLAFRLTTTLSAAEETAKTSTPPATFEPLHNWMGTLFNMYMVLAYLSIAAYGAGIVRTGLVPDWLGWVSLIFGLAGATGFVAGAYVIKGFKLFEPPLLIHLMPGLIGIFLLLEI